MDGLKPSNVQDLRPYVETGKIYAIAVGSAITRSPAPNAAIEQFLLEIDPLPQSAKPLVTV
ncbi:hypothetical protein IFO70_30965 [Phormidium tenue FACHB-886]|nr:hypothetical protein [Phormidium tenue FACHB-886]